MKTFKLDQNGDVVITNNRVEMVEGTELVAQTLRQVLNTNLGEWFGDTDEGIDYHVILTKNPNYDLIRDTIVTAIKKAADILGVEITTDNFTFDIKGRSLTVSFTFTVDGNESASVEITL